MNEDRVSPPGLTYLIADLTRSSAREKSFASADSDVAGSVAVRPGSLVESIAREESSVPRGRIVAGRYEVWAFEHLPVGASGSAIDSEHDEALGRIPSVTGSPGWLRDGVARGVEGINDMLTSGLGDEDGLPNEEHYRALERHVDSLLDLVGSQTSIPGYDDLPGGRSVPGNGPVFIPGVGGGHVAFPGKNKWTEPGMNRFGGHTKHIHERTGSVDVHEVQVFDMLGNLRSHHRTRIRILGNMRWVEDFRKDVDGDGNVSITTNRSQTSGASEAAERRDLASRPGTRGGTDTPPDDADTSKEEAEDDGTEKAASSGKDTMTEDKGSSGRSLDGSTDDSGRRPHVPLELEARLILSQDDHFLPNEGGALPIDPASGARDTGARTPGLVVITRSVEGDGTVGDDGIMFPGTRLGLQPRARSSDDQIVYQIHVIDPAHLERALVHTGDGRERLPFEE